MKYLFIDIRKSDEVYSKHFGMSGDYKFYNIPMEMIRFNKNTIKKSLEYVNEIYIVCQSGARSQYIKKKYFATDYNIKVINELQFNNLNYGYNTIKLSSDVIKVYVEGKAGFNFYSIMRIIQTLLGLLILILGGITLLELDECKKANRVPLIILMLFGLMALINGLTSTCSISIILKDYLN